MENDGTYIIYWCNAIGVFPALMASQYSKPWFLCLGYLLIIHVSRRWATTFITSFKLQLGWCLDVWPDTTINIFLAWSYIPNLDNNYDSVEFIRITNFGIFLVNVFFIVFLMINHQITCNSITSNRKLWKCIDISTKKVDGFISICCLRNNIALLPLSWYPCVSFATLNISVRIKQT